MVRIAILLLAASCAFADDRAVAALQRGDYAAAEKILRAEVAARPNEAMVLSLLGVALDGQGNTREADGFHRKAVAAAPRNPDVLSNFGNHLAQIGDKNGSKEQYLSAISLQSGHVNANVQLIRLGLERRDFAEAAKYLVNVPDSVCFPLGVAFGEAGGYGLAEELFARALKASPDDFNTLVNLGTAAAAAGHLPGAREAFDAALRQQPGNVDTAVRAAQIDLALRQPESAIRRLARVGQNRADAQRLIALAASDLGALDDSLAAWDRVVKLAPSDDAARRERGFTAVRMGRVEQGVGDLRWYLERHPEDPVVHFQLGVAEQDTAELDRAIALKPDFAAAMSARGGVLYQQGKLEAALKDLEAAAKVAPDDALTFDRLGQTYSGLDRPQDAVRVLRRASELAPGDSKTAMHLARALADAGLVEESKAAMERFKQLGPAAKGGMPAGLVEYLSMTPEQQKADYRARVEKAYRESPDDATTQVHYLKLRVEEGKDVSEVVRRLKENGDPRLPAVMQELGGKTVEFLWHAVVALGPRALPLLAGEEKEVLLLRAALTGSEELAAKVRQQWPEWAPARRAFQEILTTPPRLW